MFLRDIGINGTQIHHFFEKNHTRHNEDISYLKPTEKSNPDIMITREPL